MCSCHSILELSFLPSFSGPSYGVYISQLIRYERCCSHYDEFRCRHKCLVDRLLLQGYIALRREKSFKKFYGRYQDLIEKYQRSVNVMVSDSFPGYNFYLRCSRNLVLFLLFTWICRLDLSKLKLIASCDGCHA